MRILKVALVLLVLATFVGAVTAVSMAATVTPTMKPMATMAKPTMAAMPKATMKATAVPNATMGKPAVPAAPAATIKAPAAPTVKKMFDITPMKSTISNVYRMLKNTTKMPGKSGSGAGAGVKSKASKMMSGTMGQMASGKGQSTQLSVPAPRPLSQLGGLPQMGNILAM